MTPRHAVLTSTDFTGGGAIRSMVLRCISFYGIQINLGTVLVLENREQLTRSCFHRKLFTTQKGSNVLELKVNTSQVFQGPELCLVQETPEICSALLPRLEQLEVDLRHISPDTHGIPRSRDHESWSRMMSTTASQSQTQDCVTYLGSYDGFGLWVDTTSYGLLSQSANLCIALTAQLEAGRVIGVSDLESCKAS
ncbi:hypothetical protein RRG08_044170 [Elysia crispata]|uniref:Uncharacterized protein n=1 Tax=Elysia crispata TaxID=231223 RepID=A0AAE0XX52_9GAST|nr:hypothetical protein RRG08_044170 [Elysia crispata]